MKLLVRIGVKEGQDTGCHVRAVVVADQRQAFSFPVATPLA